MHDRYPQRKKPPLSKFRALTDQHLAVIELMTYGLDEGAMGFSAGVPLTLIQAADCVGVRRRQAREIGQTPVFIAELNRQMKGRQQSERPRNLAVAIAIRDDEGDGSAATKAVRLKAIQSIEGRDGPSSVSVNVGVQTNVTPGYVIRPRQTGSDDVDP